jgi:hypothetical protein
MRFGLFWQTPGSSVFYPTRPVSNPLMVAIAAAQRTERLRFGTLATQAPLHHPFHMATQGATCDILTQGRLDLCLGGRWGSRFGRFLWSQGHIICRRSEEWRVQCAMAFSVIPVLRTRRMWRMLSRRSTPCVHRTSISVWSTVIE